MGSLSLSISSPALCTPTLSKGLHETLFHFSLKEAFVQVDPLEDVPLQAPEKRGHIPVSP
jgi:hypothetical protein